MTLKDQLLKLKHENYSNKSLTGIISMIIGEADRVDKNISDKALVEIMRRIHKNNILTIQASKSFCRNTSDLQAENDFIKHYLPAELSDDVITSIVKDQISSGSNMGSIMKYFQSTYPCQYDSKHLADIIRKLL